MLGCATAGPHAAQPEEQKDPSRPPVAAFLGDPPLSSVRISPDGERIVGIVSRQGTQAILVQPLRGGEALSPAKFDAPGWVIRDLGWSGDRVIGVVFEDLRATARQGAPQLKAVTFRLERWRDVRPGEGWSFALPPGADPERAVLDWLPRDPQRILVTEWDERSLAARVNRVRVRDGVGEVTTPEIPGAWQWFADAAGRIRAAIVRDPEGLAQTLYARSDAEHGFEPLVGSDLAEETGFAFAGFASDPQSIYVTSSTDTGRRALYRYDLAHHRRGALVAGDPEVDVGDLVYEPNSDRLVAVVISRERPELKPLDPSFAGEEAAIAEALPDTVRRIVSADRTGRTLLVEVTGDTRPPEYFVYDRDRRQMTFLFDARPGLVRDRLVPRRAVDYPARDGAILHGYLTVPGGEETGGRPAIVVAHDGPGQRVEGGWDPVAQLLASRGFAVLEPNYRGSSGYGVEYERAGRRDDGAGIAEDLADGAAWLVSEGIADPDRIGVYGIGIGGTAALSALAATPSPFRAAASYGAVTDWVALDAASGPQAAELPVSGGTATGRARLADLSPLQHAGAMAGPLLIGHGELDALVPVEQARAMGRALGAAGADFELELYPGTAHGLETERHRIDFYEHLLAFFERNLHERIPL